MDSSLRVLGAVLLALTTLSACDLSVQAGEPDGGAADAGEVADSGVCQPRKCGDPGAQCGDPADLCGATLHCGGCSGALTCGTGSSAFTCVVPLCQNKIKDPGESDVDCGGSCGPCAIGQRCNAPSDCPANATCEQHVCLAGRWTQAAPLPTARLSPAAVVTSSDQIWVLGGFTSQGATDVVEVYDPATDSWTSAPPMRQPRYGHAAALGLDGRLYVFGGQYDSQTMHEGTSATAEVYDFASHTWSALPNLPEGRYNCSAALLPDSTFILIGGMNVTRAASLANTAIFTPSTSTWSSAPSPLVTGRNAHASLALPDGRIFVAGGFGASGRTDSAEMYNPGVGGWSTLPKMPLANADQSAAQGPGNQILLFGGNAGNGNLTEVLSYDTAKRAWGIGPSLLRGRRGAAAARTSDGRIWLVGGSEVQNLMESPSDANEVLGF